MTEPVDGPIHATSVASKVADLLGIDRHGEAAVDEVLRPEE